MTIPINLHEAKAMWGLLAIGLLCLVIAIFQDPLGSTPDSGEIDLGPTGTRWLLGAFGSAFLIAGAWVHFKKRSSGST
jgi:hypothetical protein